MSLPEVASAKQIVDVSISEPRFVGAVLERLVSAAAARAELPVDRVVNAMTLVDALVHASNTVLGDSPRNLQLVIGEGSLGLRVDHLFDGQAEALRAATNVPNLGDVFAHTASAVSIEHDGTHSALVILLN